MYDFLGFLMFRRGDRSVQAGDMISAVKWMEEAAHYVPRSAEFRTNLAVFLAKTGSPEDAVDQCELAAHLDGGRASAGRNLVKLCLGLAQEQVRHGQPQAARATLRRALPFASGKELIEVQGRLAELSGAVSPGDRP